MNCQLVLLKLSVESEMDRGGSNIDWSSMSNISFCYKASLFKISIFCCWTMMSPAAISAHVRDFFFFYDGIENVEGMINGKEIPLTLNTFCQSYILSHQTYLSSNEFNYYYVALLFYRGGLARKLLVDAKEME